MNCRMTEKENQMARKKIPRVKIKLKIQNKYITYNIFIDNRMN